MEVCSGWEIHIPVEAEVKNIPLKSLPASVLRRMGLTVSDSDSSRKPTDSSEVIWICPAVIGRKGEGQKRKLWAENTTEFLGTEFQGGPLKMSFVSSNRAAREVLKNIPAGKPLPKKEPVCQDSALQANQDAVVIYNGQIYLCIRKGRKRRQKAEERPSARTTKELRRQKIKTDAGKVMSSKKAELKRSGSTAECSPPRPPHSGHRADANSQYVNAAELSSEQTASSVQPQENQRNPTNRTSGEHEMINCGEEEASAWTSDMDGSQDGLTMPESLDVDFNELEQEERIAQAKAKFSFAINNLPS